MDLILAATDFSAQGNSAVAHAASLASRLDARVHVVHAWLLPPTAIAIDALPRTGPVYQRLEEEADAAMARLIASYRTLKVPIDGEVAFGHAPDVVIAAAERLHAAMIVVGTHARAEPQRPLVGSVALAIVRRAPCPVLVVRQDPRR